VLPVGAQQVARLAPDDGGRGARLFRGLLRAGGGAACLRHVLNVRGSSSRVARAARAPALLHPMTVVVSPAQAGPFCQRTQMKRTLLLLCAGLAACGGNSSAPAGPPPSLVTPTMLQPPPIYALLGHRDRLERTSNQIVSLDSIAVQLKEENDGLIDELQELSDVARNQPALIVGDEGRPILEQIRDNNREASEAVGRVLTSDQQTATCDL